MDAQFLWKLLVTAAVIAALRQLLRVYDAVVAQPRRLRSALRSQGLSGPPPSFLLGNILEMKRARDAAAKSAPAAGAPSSHNCGAALLPFFDEWRKNYGNILSPASIFFTRSIEIANRRSNGVVAGGERKTLAGDTFVFSLGSTLIMHVTQPEMVREITTCTSLDLGKPTYQARERGSLLGNGILTSNGAHWLHQRKILAPELYMDKVKVQIHQNQLIDRSILP